MPAIFEPHLIGTGLASIQYRPNDLVIGVSNWGEQRASNVAHLSNHEIVNDVVGGKPIAVTW